VNEAFEAYKKYVLEDGNLLGGGSNKREEEDKIKDRLLYVY